MAGNFQRNAYLDTQIKTASKDKLLLMLFDGAIKFSHQAKAAIAERDIQESANTCIKVQNIMSELMGALDGDMISPELYQNLMSLYAFVHKRMVSANLERDAKYVDEAIQILHHLRGIWQASIEQVLEENDGKMPAMPAPSPQKPSVASQVQTPEQPPQHLPNVTLAPRQGQHAKPVNRAGAAAGARAYQQKPANEQSTPQAPAPAAEGQKFPLPAAAAASQAPATPSAGKPKLNLKAKPVQTKGKPKLNLKPKAGPVDPAKKDAAAKRPKLNLKKS